MGSMRKKQLSKAWNAIQGCPKCHHLITKASDRRSVFKFSRHLNVLKRRFNDVITIMTNWQETYAKVGRVQIHKKIALNHAWTQGTLTPFANVIFLFFYWKIFDHTLKMLSYTHTRLRFFPSRLKSCIRWIEQRIAVL